MMMEERNKFIIVFFTMNPNTRKIQNRDENIMKTADTKINIQFINLI